LIGRALFREGYRSILPHGVYPAGFLFIETPLEEVDVNVHPAKTECDSDGPQLWPDAVREAVKTISECRLCARRTRDVVEYFRPNTSSECAMSERLERRRQGGPTDESVATSHGYARAGGEHQQS